MKVEERQKLLLILTIALVGLYASDLLVFEPLVKLWTTRSKAIVSLRSQVKDGKFMLLREAGIRSQWGEMSSKTLPNNTSAAEQQVLKAFDNWSQESGATVTGITPQWKNDSTNYMTLNCRVEASGDLGTLSRFVYDIEQNAMALKLDSVEFSAHDNEGQQLTLGLQLNGLALTALKK
jgi:Tfp pilus assembly protein PilO